jgi:hypothetical protein
LFTDLFIISQPTTNAFGGRPLSPLAAAVAAPPYPSLIVVVAIIGIGVASSAFQRMGAIHRPLRSSAATVLDHFHHHCKGGCCAICIAMKLEPLVMPTTFLG